MKELVALVAVLSLAACSSAHNSSSASPSTTSRTSGTAAGTVPASATRPQPLSTRLELPVGSMIAGTTITGHLVVDNNTGKPRQLVPPGGCYPGFAVALGNDKIPPEAAFGASCTTGQPFVIPVGESRFVFSVRASYAGCSNTGHPQGTVPKCLAGGRAVPLPVGEYKATFIDDGIRLPHPAAVPVRVLATAEP